MITIYFLRQFCTHGALFFGVITTIFASANLLIRLPFIHSATAIPQIVISMLPLMVLFSLPLASGMAVHAVIASHRLRDELLPALFLPSLAQAIKRSVLIFSSCCVLMYGVFVFYLAPASYQNGKALLVSVAKEHFLQLEPHKFHTPYSGITFFFKSKRFEVKNPVFCSLLLIFTTKHNERYFFTAERGSFVNNTLILYNGTLHTIAQNHFHSATFAETEIDVLKLISKEQQSLQRISPKFLSLNQLLALQAEDKGAYIELAKRFAQTLWQFLLPLILFFIAWGSAKTSFVATLMSSGGLYIFSYIAIIFGQSCGDSTILSLMVLYGIPLMITFAAWYFFYKN